MASVNEEFTRETYYGGEREKEAIRIAKERYGLSDNSSVIRFALAMIADPDVVTANITARRVKKHGGKLK